ncbi:hypothetical protein LCGC14_2065300, partial [marine sediment metagenome]
AYCNSPLCSPSRQSFMAGLHCHEIDMWNNTAAMPPDTVTWAHMLSQGGYETSLIGKMHFNGYQKMYGFDRRPVLEGSNDGQNFYSWGLRTSHDWRDPLPYTSGNMSDGLCNAGPDTPERQNIFRKDMEVLEGTLAGLRDKAERKDDRPWAICASFVLPHPPWKARADILETYLGKGDLPANRAGLGRDTCDRYIQQYYGDLMNLPEDVIRKAREVYFALITEFDEHAGKILDCLAETGLAEDTVVFYFSDHGEMAGEHGLWAKGCFYEGAVGIPLIARLPGCIPSGSVSGAVCSLTDIGPTLTDVAGAGPMHAVDGRSLWPTMRGEHPPDWPDETYSELADLSYWPRGANGPDDPYCPYRMIRSGRWKLWVHADVPAPAAALFDLHTDPGELHDLSADPAFRDVHDRLLAKLYQGWDPARVRAEAARATANRDALAAWGAAVKPPHPDCLPPPDADLTADVELM